MPELSYMEREWPEKKHDSKYCPDCESEGHIVGTGPGAEPKYECRDCYRSWWRPPQGGA